MTKDPFFAQYLDHEVMNEQDKIIIQQLSYVPTENQKLFSNTNYRDSNFLPIFTNRARGFDPIDVSMDQYDAFPTKQGYRQPLPTFKDPSLAASTISFDVIETDNLDFTKMISIWVNYIQNISDGTFDANPDMIKNGKLDYMSSIYYFRLAPDGQTITYWSKYTGCWPNVIPYSSMRYAKGSSTVTELSLIFNYTVKEDMNPQILEDFNKSSLNMSYSLIREGSEENLPIRKSAYLTRSDVKNFLGTDSIYSHQPLVVATEKNNTINGQATDYKWELIFSLKDIVEGSHTSSLYNSKYFIDPEQIFGL